MTGLFSFSIKYRTEAFAPHEKGSYIPSHEHLTRHFWQDPSESLIPQHDQKYETTLWAQLRRRTTLLCGLLIDRVVKANSVEKKIYNKRVETCDTLTFDRILCSFFQGPHILNLSNIYS